MQNTLNLLCPFVMVRLSWEVVREGNENGEERERGKETNLLPVTLFCTERNTQCVQRCEKEHANR